MASFTSARVSWLRIRTMPAVLVPVTLVFIAPLPPVQGRTLLEYIATNKVVYLTELVCFVGLAVPALVVFTAVALALKDVDKNLAVLGGLFGVSSEPRAPCATSIRLRCEDEPVRSANEG